MTLSYYYKNREKVLEKAKIKRKKMALLHPEENISRIRKAWAKYNNGIVFYCKKCGALSTSKDKKQTLCKKCRPKVTPEQKKQKARAWRLKNIEKCRNYRKEYSQIGKPEKTCIKCGKIFHAVRHKVCLDCREKEVRCELCKRKFKTLLHKTICPWCEAKKTYKKIDKKE